MKKNTKFVGNKIPLSLYNKLVSYSEKTAKHKQRIISEALDEYFQRKDAGDGPAEDKKI